MSKIYHNITELIGHTPLVELHGLERELGTDAHIYGKLEFFNPSGSVKDRIALNMINAKEAAGELKPGGTIIEGTSGNTGIGIASIGAAKGYNVKICMPDNLSAERTKILKAFGAEVYHTPGAQNMAGAGAKAAELLLRRALWCEYGTDALPEIALGPKGKPSFPALPGLQFNLSHCRRAVACALDTAPAYSAFNCLTSGKRCLSSSVISPTPEALSPCVRM